MEKNKELRELIELSLYAGERFDLIQAGGGNTSAKLDDGTMFIKASGCSLSEMTLSNGYVKVDKNRINSILTNPELLNMPDKRNKDSLSIKLVSGCVLDSSGRPSIETFLHSLMEKYTLHTHPIVVNALTIKKNWQEILSEMFPEALYVGYKTPGIELALELYKELGTYQKKYNQNPKITFLQNHGLIVSSNTLEDVYKTNEIVLDQLEAYLSTDFSAYRNVTKISQLYNSTFQTNSICYLVRSKFLNYAVKEFRQTFFLDSFCPDVQVFCGKKALELSNLEDKKSLEEFERQNHHLPRILVYKDNVYCISSNVKKAKELEDVLEFSIHTFLLAKENYNFLTDAEVDYLENWDAEKYRKEK